MNRRVITIVAVLLGMTGCADDEHSLSDEAEALMEQSQEWSESFASNSLE